MKILLAFFFTCSFGLISEGQVNYQIVYPGDFELSDSLAYLNPNYDAKTLSEPSWEGAVFGHTFISDSTIKSFDDLDHMFDIRHAWVPTGWPRSIDLKYAVFVLCQFETGQYLPAIQTPDGSLFSFLIEDGFLSIDYKEIVALSKMSIVDFVTFSVEKESDQ